MKRNLRIHLQSYQHSVILYPQSGWSTGAITGLGQRILHRAGLPLQTGFRRLVYCRCSLLPDVVVMPQGPLPSSPLMTGHYSGVDASASSSVWQGAGLRSRALSVQSPDNRVGTSRSLKEDLRQRNRR